MGFRRTKYTFLMYFLHKNFIFIRIYRSDVNCIAFGKTPRLIRSALSTSRPFLRTRYPLSSLPRKKVHVRNCMNYISMERRNVKVFRDMSQNMVESRIFCKNVIYYDRCCVDRTSHRKGEFLQFLFLGLTSERKVLWIEML